MAVYSNKVMVVYSNKVMAVYTNQTLKEFFRHNMYMKQRGGFYYTSHAL